MTTRDAATEANAVRNATTAAACDLLHATAQARQKHRAVPENATAIAAIAVHLRAKAHPAAACAAHLRAKAHPAAVCAAHLPAAVARVAAAAKADHRLKAEAAAIKQETHLHTDSMLFTVWQAASNDNPCWLGMGSSSNEYQPLLTESNKALMQGVNGT